MFLASDISANVTIDYLYDNEGKPYKLLVDENGTVYTGYYVLNQQGDVIAILDAEGNVAVSYTYDAWGSVLDIETAGADGVKLSGYNALMYRGYYYDAETGFYYVSSRYYDPVIGRFINADTTDVLIISPTALTDKNLYAYCDNNPVIRKDDIGELWAVVAGIVISGGIIGAVMGAFSAAATGGNIFESTIKGGLTGMIGSACGLIPSAIIPTWGAIVIATIGGSIVDFGMQVTSQYIENKSVDISRVNGWSCLKTGLLTGLGTAIPAFPKWEQDKVFAFGTGLAWAEGSVLITSADVALTNAYSGSKTKPVGRSTSRNKSSSGKTTCRITTTIADYFRQQYN